jgi:hypothetical protein
MERPRANTPAVARMLLTAGCQEGGYARRYLQPSPCGSEPLRRPGESAQDFTAVGAMCRNQVEVKRPQFAAGYRLDEGGSWRGRYRLG